MDGFSEPISFFYVGIFDLFKQSVSPLLSKRHFTLSQCVRGFLPEKRAFKLPLFFLLHSFFDSFFFSKKSKKEGSLLRNWISYFRSEVPLAALFSYVKRLSFFRPF